ncbi:hypothetical protein ACOSP7_029679 [Xanthoceras sorbifolium]
MSAKLLANSTQMMCTLEVLSFSSSGESTAQQCLQGMNMCWLLFIISEQIISTKQNPPPSKKPHKLTSTYQHLVNYISCTAFTQPSTLKATETFVLLITPCQNLPISLVLVST